MNPDLLPALGRVLRNLGAYAQRHDVHDQTLVEIANDLDEARQLVEAARGSRTGNRCPRHPGGPVDPTVGTGCLLCGATERRPARPLPADFEPGEVLHFLNQYGPEETNERYGARAVARALAIVRRHPSAPQPPQPAPPDSTNVEGEIPS